MEKWLLTTLPTCIFGLHWQKLGMAKSEITPLLRLILMCESKCDPSQQNES